MRSFLTLSILLLTAISIFVAMQVWDRQKASQSMAIPLYERHALLDESSMEQLTFDPLQAPLFAKDKRGTMSSSGQKNLLSSVITKEFFRCRGSSLHPPIPVVADGKIVENIFDCSGSSSHSLPMRDGKEYIYPVLIELLNAIQEKTGRLVVITSGHRCPQHHRYVGAKGGLHNAKHMIGASVTFYVAGLEDKPKEVIKALFDYYKDYPVPEKEKSKYTDFSRSDKPTDTSTPPWYNKEIMIKWYKPNEGRDGDNYHPYPYFSIQVRFDREKKKTVLFQEQEAEHMCRF